MCQVLNKFETKPAISLCLRMPHNLASITWSASGLQRLEKVRWDFESRCDIIDFLPKRWENQILHIDGNRGNTEPDFAGLDSCELSLFSYKIPSTSNRSVDELVSARQDSMKITHQRPLLWSFLFRKSQFAFSISRNAGGKVKLVNTCRW